MEHQSLPSETYNAVSLFYSLNSVRENLLQQKGGKWTLFSRNNIQKLDEWWVALQILCNNGTLIAIKSSTATDQVDCCILCYTPDSENENEIKVAADEIRRLTNYEYPMYYKASKFIDARNPDLGKKEIFLYEHTVTGEFYKKEMNTFLPSNVHHKPYLYYFGTAVISDEEKERSGKWTLHSFGEINQLDHRWKVLKSLCDDGVVMSVGSSTAARNPRRDVTNCFTSDFKNAKEVKKAADEIRKLIDYEYTMYYTTTEKLATGPRGKLVMIYSDRYMHTVKGGFYEKDKYSRWVSLMA